MHVTDDTKVCSDVGREREVSGGMIHSESTARIELKDFPFK